VYLSKTNSFVLDKTFGNFEELSEGQTIGIDGDERIEAPKKSVILFAHNVNKVGAEAFLLGEKKKSLA